MNAKPITDPVTDPVAQMSGRVVELCGAACLSVAMRFLSAYQRRNQPVVWIGITSMHFYPPDAAAAGIDLESLPVVLLGEAAVQRAALDRVTDVLLRSGAFAAVFLDCGVDATLGMASLGRFMRLTKRYNTALVVLSPRFWGRLPIPAGQGRLGSLVSLRISCSYRSRGDGTLAYSLHAIKDRVRGREWHDQEVFRAPPGLP